MDDLISRQAVLDLQYRIDDSATLSTRDVVNVEDIEELPPVNPQPKTGHWIRVTDKTGHFLGWQCDKCGLQQRFNTNFCPDCGARMESEEQE